MLPTNRLAWALISASFSTLKMLSWQSFRLGKTSKAIKGLFWMGTGLKRNQNSFVFPKNWKLPKVTRPRTVCFQSIQRGEGPRVNHCFIFKETDCCVAAARMTKGEMFRLKSTLIFRESMMHMLLCKAVLRTYWEFCVWAWSPSKRTPTLSKGRSSYPNWRLKGRMRTQNIKDCVI